MPNDDQDFDLEYLENDSDADTEEISRPFALSDEDDEDTQQVVVTPKVKRRPQVFIQSRRPFTGSLAADLEGSD